jgi:hypothetical protein
LSIYKYTFFWGSSFNDGTSQTVLDPIGRGAVRTIVANKKSRTFTPRKKKGHENVDKKIDNNKSHDFGVKRTKSSF